MSDKEGAVGGDRPILKTKRQRSATQEPPLKKQTKKKGSDESRLPPNHSVALSAGSPRSGSHRRSGPQLRRSDRLRERESPPKGADLESATYSKPGRSDTSGSDEEKRVPPRTRAVSCPTVRAPARLSIEEGGAGSPSSPPGPRSVISQARAAEGGSSDE